MGRELGKRGIAYQYLDGTTPAEARGRKVQAFQQGGDPFFLISLKAGGTGINLTAANYVVHLDPWWNPAVEDQASNRAHRLGQEQAVTVYRLVGEGTLEEGILDLHQAKRRVAADVLNGADLGSRLSEKELLGLFGTCS